MLLSLASTSSWRLASRCSNITRSRTARCWSDCALDSCVLLTPMPGGASLRSDSLEDGRRSTAMRAPAGSSGWSCGSLVSVRNCSPVYLPYLAHFCSFFRYFFAVFSVLTSGIQQAAPKDRAPVP